MNAYPLADNKEYTPSDSVAFIRGELERLVQEIRSIDSIQSNDQLRAERNFSEIRKGALRRRQFLEAALRAYKGDLRRLESEILLGDIDIVPGDFESAVLALYQFLARRKLELAADEREAYVACHQWLQAHEVVP